MLARGARSVVGATPNRPQAYAFLGAKLDRLERGGRQRSCLEMADDTDDGLATPVERCAHEPESLAG